MELWNLLLMILNIGIFKPSEYCHANWYGKLQTLEDTHFLAFLSSLFFSSVYITIETMQKIVNWGKNNHTKEWTEWKANKACKLATVPLEALWVWSRSSYRYFYLLKTARVNFEKQTAIVLFVKHCVEKENTDSIWHINIMSMT